jgi:hypothetical protein
LICTLVIGGCTWFGSHSGYFRQPSFLLPTLVFLLFSTGLLFVYLYKANKPIFFTQLYLLTMVIKLVAYLGFILVIIMKDRAGALSNVVFFMTVYFIFTVLEIGFLFHKINRSDRP